MMKSGTTNEDNYISRLTSSSAFTQNAACPRAIHTDTQPFKSVLNFDSSVTQMTK